MAKLSAHGRTELCRFRRTSNFKGYENEIVPVIQTYAYMSDTHVLYRGQVRQSDGRLAGTWHDKGKMDFTAFYNRMTELNFKEITK